MKFTRGRLAKITTEAGGSIKAPPVFEFEDK
jgi:hypothetical protein